VSFANLKRSRLYEFSAVHVSLFVCKCVLLFVCKCVLLFVCKCVLLFVCKCVLLYVCKCVLLPPGINPIAVKYIISYLAETLFARLVFVVEIWVSTGRSLFYLISFCAISFEPDLKVYTTFRMYAIIFGLTRCGVEKK
jgi:hypothetical protein